MRFFHAGICALGAPALMIGGGAQAQAGKTAPVSANGSTNPQPAGNAVDNNLATRWDTTEITVSLRRHCRLTICDVDPGQEWPDQRSRFAKTDSQIEALSFTAFARAFRVSAQHR